MAQHAILGQAVDAIEGIVDLLDLRDRLRLRAGRQRRVEAHLEELDQHPRDVGVRRQRGFDERLRQRETDLAHVLRVGTKDDDLFRRQARRDDQPIEVVVLDFATENFRERILEDRVQGVDLDFRVDGGGQHAEVVHPHRRRIERCDPVRTLVDHLETHPFEHRQAVGQRNRSAAMEQLEAQRAGKRVQRPVQRKREWGIRRQPRHQRDVGHGGERRKVLAIPGRKCASEATEELAAARLALGVDQCTAKIVLPSAGGSGETRLELAHVERGHVARRRAHRDQNACEHRFRQVRVEFRAGAVERLHQYRLPLSPQLGRIVFARGKDEAREESSERIAAHEKPKALPFAEMQNSQCRHVQVVFARLHDHGHRAARFLVEEAFDLLAGGRGGHRPTVRPWQTAGP